MIHEIEAPSQNWNTRMKVASAQTRLMSSVAISRIGVNIDRSRNISTRKMPTITMSTTSGYLSVTIFWYS